MFFIPWYAILLMTVPQIFLIIKLGFRLFNLEIDNKTCLTASLLSAAFVYIVRAAQNLPGFHTVMILLVVTLLVSAINHTYVVSSLISILLGFLILGVIEGMWLPILFGITSSTMADLEIHPWLNIIGFYPILAVAIIIYVIVIRNKIVIFDLQRLGPFNEKQE